LLSISYKRIREKGEKKMIRRKLFSKGLLTLVFGSLLSFTFGIPGHTTDAEACVDPPSGMISWWPGDGNTFDIIGPNCGTLMNGATFAPGMVGQAFSFDGVDDQVVASGTDINDLQNLTIDAWVSHNSLPSEIQRYVTITGEALAVLRYDGADGPQQLHFFMRIDGVLRHIRFNNALQVGIFHHVAGTYDGSVMRLYLDGAEVGNLAVSGTVGDANGVVLSMESEPLDGLLDEVEIYNRALSASEIQAIFNEGSEGKCKLTGSVSGRVTTINGDPIEDLWVHAFPCPCWATELEGVYTDEDGNYTISGLPAGGVYVKSCAGCDSLDYLDEWWDGNDGTPDCNLATPVTVLPQQNTSGIDFDLEAIPLTTRELYDDFSGTYIDSKKWDNRELVREVMGGKLVSKIGNNSGTGFFDNNTSFQDPASINTIESEITLVVINLDTGNDPMSFARIGGYFYNTQASGGATGDIWAAVFIGDRGSGLEAFWEVEEALDDDLTNFELKGSGTLIGPGTLTHGNPYIVKLDYDGNTGFEFTVAGESESFIGPARQRAAVTEFKALITGIDADGGSGTGYVHSLFDDVYINNEATAYDTFTTSPLDPANWQTSEVVREIAGGKLRMNIHSYYHSETGVVRCFLNKRNTSYFEAKVEVDSDSWVSSGNLGYARIQGWYYNESRGPGSGLPYNESEDEVLAENRIILDESGNLVVRAIVGRCDTPDPWGAYTILFAQDFTMPIAFDTEYVLSIEFTGSLFIFRCDGETQVYNVTTSFYPSRSGSRHLSSLAYGDPGQASYIKAQFDDVYVSAVDRGDELVVDFGANGLWHYDGGAWTNPAGWDPDGDMVDWDNGLAVDFGTYGLWNYDGTSWASLAGWDAADIEAYNSGLAVDFDTYGVWYYDGSSWTSLAGWNPGNMEEWSGGLAVVFGTYGLWNYDGSSWASLAGWDPGGMERYGAGLAADFNTYGLWYYEGASWSNLAGWNPEVMKVWDHGLAVDFGTYGLWNYDGSTWTSLAGWNPGGMEAYGNGLAVDFDAYGVWYYDGSTWTSLAGWNPEDMEAWGTGLAVDFGSYGLWNYDGSSWSNLAGWDPEDMIDVDLY
jgi:hypothetical protein